MSSPNPKTDARSRVSLHPPNRRPRLLHIALIFSHLLGRVSPVMLAPVWLALAAIGSYPWSSLRLSVAVLSLAFIVADGIGLALLPRLGRSFGPVTPPLLALSLGRTTASCAVGVLWGGVRPSGLIAAWPVLLLIAAVHLAITGLFLYATWIEPFRIEVTQASLRSRKLKGDGRLRLLHISDLHIERITPREEELVRLTERLAPDVVVFTGDYLSLSCVHAPEAQGEAHELLERICDHTRGPAYAIPGSPPVDPPEVVPAMFEDLPITWLLDEVVELELKGHRVRLAGLRCTGERSLDGPRLRRLLDGSVEQTFTLLLYHSPDLMPEAVELGVDLYLCGHTHGGQVRLPLFGAVITSSDFWKRYEMGRFEESGTTMYVSRGLGMEGLGAPRARFLAPPEVIVWTLSS